MSSASTDPWMTPNRRPQPEPDTAPRELVYDTPGTEPPCDDEQPPCDDEAETPICAPASRPRGRPPSKRPRGERDERFSGKGAPTAEGWGFIRAYHECMGGSLSDLAFRFNVARSTLAAGLKRPLGAMSAVAPPAPLAQESERDACVASILREMPKASVSQVHAELCRRGVEGSRSSAYNSLRSVAVLRARPKQAWSGGDEARWRETRLAFATTVMEDLPEPESLLFSDESLFRVTDNRKEMWCPEGVEPEGVQVHAWAAGAHVWGCIGQDFRVLVPLNLLGTGPKGGITSEDYAKFLELHFLPAFKRHQQRHPRRTFWFVQDGARVHTTPQVLALIRSWGLKVFVRNKDDGLAWPPHSPDLNPIENLWSLCNRRIMAELAPDLSNSKAAKAALWSALKREWVGFSSELITRLVESFETRIALCIAKKGGPTGY